MVEGRLYYRRGSCVAAGMLSGFRGAGRQMQSGACGRRRVTA